MANATYTYCSQLSGAALTRLIERRRKTNATAAKKAGAPIRSLDELAVMVRDGQSVFHAGAWGLLPATVVMNMQARVVHSAIKSGLLRRYTP